MVRLNRIYTRTGDDGTTGLVDGSRLPKHAPRLEAVGAIDEANSAIGWAAQARPASGQIELDPESIGRLRRIQNDLFDLGADLATPGDDFAPSDTVLRIVPAQVAWLEQRIDSVNDTLEPLRSFVLPGGSESAARLHIARAAVRRAERTMTGLAAREPVNPAAVRYLNRLSDHLFVLSRWLNEKGTKDVLWVPGANR